MTLINDILGYLGSIINNNYLLAPIVSLVAGIIASLSPCNLSSIPLVIGYITKNSKYNSFLLSIVFSIGSACTFVVLGIMASTLNTGFYFVGDWWYVVLSFICIIMVLEFWDVIHIIPSGSKLLSNYHAKGIIGALITGILAGLVASPCSTPVLVVILTIAGTKGSILYGVILLIYYSIGHSALAIITGISSKKVLLIKQNKNYKILNKIVTYGFGIIILLMSFYFFYLGV